MPPWKERLQELRVVSTKEVRAAFPALERRHEGFPVAYFDGPGGTQVPRAVVEAMANYLFQHNANTHWAFPTSAETDAALAGARRVLADFVNASPDEIVFGANMTSLTLRVSRALGRRLGPATRSLSPSWTTTPISIPGGPSHATAESPSASPG